MARLMFPLQDDALLNYGLEEGQKIEPEYYCPIIPLVLVNGCSGIATGWSTDIPNFNPRDVIENIRRRIRGEALLPMVPWYRGFEGTVETSAKAGSYKCRGQCTPPCPNGMDCYCMAKHRSKSRRSLL